MGNTLITNPTGALRTVSDYRTFRADDGSAMEFGKGETYAARAAVAITAGQALEFTVPTATVPMTVTPMATATDQSLFAGIALEDAAAGTTVPFMRRGFAHVFTDDSDTPAFGQHLLKPNATAGQCATADVALAADGLPILGLVLSAEAGGAGLRKAFVLLDPTIGSTNPDTSA